MKRSTIARALTTTAVILAAGAGITRTLLASMTPVPRITPPSIQARRFAIPPGDVHSSLAGLTVSSVTGPVERRAGPDDPWRPVQTGETIARSESLRTGSGGAAVLELQDHTTIWLWPESEVAADRLDNELARVGLAGGRLDLNVPQRIDRSLEVTAPGGATASTHGAHFSIIVDGAHVATVATREGAVDVVSASGRVRVPPGMQTRARPGAVPEVAVPIPAELLLQVDWPSTTLRSTSAVLHGRAPAGVLVSVGTTHVVVANDGTFAQPVQLTEGDNLVEVRAQDVVGHSVVRRSPTIRVDTRPPSVGAHGRWE